MSRKNMHYCSDHDTYYRYNTTCPECRRDAAAAANERIIENLEGIADNADFEDKISELQDQLEELRRQQESPGQYTCPECLSRALNRGANRCMRCGAEMDPDFWLDIYKTERLAAEAKAQQEREMAAERDRLAKIAAQRAQESSFSSRPTCPQQTTSEGNGCALSVVVIIGILVVAFVGSKTESKNETKPAAQVAIGESKASEPMPQPVVSTPSFKGPWSQGMRLNLHSGDRAEHLNYDEGNSRLLVANKFMVLEKELLYADKEPATQGVFSSSSNSGRYRFLTLCSKNWCDDTRFIDMTEKVIVPVDLSKSGATQGVSWSPGEKYVLVKWKHGGESGIDVLNIETLAINHMPDDFIISVFQDESGTIEGSEGERGPSQSVSPSVAFNIASAEWKGDNEVHINGEVIKIRLKKINSDTFHGDPVVSGSITLGFSVPNLKITLVTRVAK